MYAVTGVTGVPLSFLVIGVCLALLSVGFLAVSYRQKHAGAAYAVLAAGLNPSWGVAGGFVALTVYPALQIALYGLIGTTMADAFGRGSWQTWAWLAWLGVALVGMLRYTLGQYAVAGVTLVELALIAMMIVAAFTHPHDGHITTAPVRLNSLWTVGVGGVFAFGIAAFLGFETGPAFAEEIKSDRSVISATAATLIFQMVFFGLAAWALPVWTGAADIASAANGRLPFDILDRNWGYTAGTFAELCLITSCYISSLSFHNTATRYIFALGRERVLPQAVSRVGLLGGRFAGTPSLASLAQSAAVGVVLAGFQVVGADPMADMFVWLSSGAALAILVLLVAVSLAAVGFFRSGQGGRENVWIRTILPLVGAVVGAVLAAVIAFNQATLLNLPSGSGWQWLIPVCIGLVVGGGLFCGWLIKLLDPGRYALIGRGQPDPRYQRDEQLGEIRG